MVYTTVRGPCVCNCVISWCQDVNKNILDSDCVNDKQKHNKQKIFKEIPHLIQHTK